MSCKTRWWLYSTVLSVCRRYYCLDKITWCDNNISPVFPITCYLTRVHDISSFNTDIDHRKKLTRKEGFIKHWSYFSSTALQTNFKSLSENTISQYIWRSVCTVVFLLTKQMVHEPCAANTCTCWTVSLSTTIMATSLLRLTLSNEWLLEIIIIIVIILRTLWN